MAAQVPRVAPAANFVIPLTTGGGYVLPTDVPKIRHTLDGSIVGNTASFGDLPLFLFHPHLEPDPHNATRRVLGIREATPAEFPNDTYSQGRFYPDCVYVEYRQQWYRAYVCLSMTGVPQHWLLAHLVIETQTDYFARRFLDQRANSGRVHLQLVLSVEDGLTISWFSSPLQSPAYRQGIWPDPQPRTLLDERQVLISRVGGYHIYQCLGRDTRGRGRRHWIFGNVTQTNLTGPYGPRNDAFWNSYLKIDEFGMAKHWVLVPFGYKEEFEHCYPGIRATVTRP